MTEVNIIPFKKTPIGTIDIYDVTYDELKRYIFFIETLFIQYGGKGLETPMFEIRENLLSKYGEEAENLLIYNLVDTNNDDSSNATTNSNTREKYTLRYDLTIPKVRHIVSNNIIKDRIYSIGKVFRRDNPSLGRYREFYQADFDIIGESNTSMINEYLLFKMIKQFMTQLNMAQLNMTQLNIDYKIYINFTQNLKWILIDQLKCDVSMFKKICSTIDKLDKCNFTDLINEFKQKGLDDEQIILLKTLLFESSEPRDTESNNLFKKLINLINLDTELPNKVIFCPTLARGLDYYEGIIYEVKIISSQLDTSPSIISGGRYDNLIPNTTLIGLSFGLSRIISIMNRLVEKTSIYSLSSQVNFVWKEQYYLSSMKGIKLEDKIKYWNLLEKRFNQQIIIADEEQDKKLIKVITYCVTNGIKYLYVLAPDELKNGQIIMKNLMDKTQVLIDIGVFI